MSYDGQAETIEFMRERLKAVPAEQRDGYLLGLHDMMIVSDEVPFYGTYIDTEVHAMSRSLVKALGLPMQKDMRA